MSLRWAHCSVCSNFCQQIAELRRSKYHMFQNAETNLIELIKFMHLRLNDFCQFSSFQNDGGETSSSCLGQICGVFPQCDGEQFSLTPTNCSLHPKYRMVRWDIYKALLVCKTVSSDATAILKGKLRTSES